MKKKFIITTVIALLFCVVIVNTMADPSGIAPLNRVTVDQLSTHADSTLYSSLDNTKKAPIKDSNSGNATTLLSMLMIGLALVGLASFRESKEEKTGRLDRRLQ